MQYNSEKHHRRSIRLKKYDYSSAGAYFVTICTQNRECLFGVIDNGEMVLNDVGEMIQKWYSKIESKFHTIQCEQFVCMPNHVHFIVKIVGADPCVCPGSETKRAKHPMASPKGEHTGPPLHDAIRWFKTMSTNEYIQQILQNGWKPFSKKLWQRNYWEHIIRNDIELYFLREYIKNNPVQWEEDKLYTTYS